MKISTLMQQMFPNGTRPVLEDGSAEWKKIPVWPPDLFAFTATLVERSGAYQKVVAIPSEGFGCDPFGLQGGWSESLELRAKAIAWGFLRASTADAFTVEESDYTRQSLATHANFWDSHNDKNGCPNRFRYDFDDLNSVDWAFCVDDWREIISKPDEDIQSFSADDSIIPDWCKAALRLMILMDTASVGVGFIASPISINSESAVEPAPLNWIKRELSFALSKRIKIDELKNQKNWAEKDSDTAWFSTITSDSLTVKGFHEDSGEKTLGVKVITSPLSVFDTNSCAVLPKTRTSTIGCTLRSMTHHLALLPPSSDVEARWRMPADRPLNPKTTTFEKVAHGLNLLVIPFPYKINARAFKPGNGLADTDFSDSSKWGFYDIEQNWLHDKYNGTSEDAAEKFKLFVRELVRQGHNELGEIHGVIFPEFALNSHFFNTIAEDLRAEFTKDDPMQGFEFIVAGMSEEPRELGVTMEPRKGNFVSLLGLQRLARTNKYPEKNGRHREWSLRGSREKHHRWKLNGRQIERYGLSSKLDPKLSWWEGIPLSRRIIEFFQLRSGTSTTILICEDLARADPVQSVLRAIGPNLVIALLMDGPQRSYRWPGHYAGSLADDPGCSVLTITSYGLIDRSSAFDGSHSRSIGYFKGSYGKEEQELQLPVGAHALALRLVAKERNEHTLDGRGDGGNAYVWHLVDVCPVQTRVTSENGWIFGHAN